MKYHYYQLKNNFTKSKEANSIPVIIKNQKFLNINETARFF